MKGAVMGSREGRKMVKDQWRAAKMTKDQWRAALSGRTRHQRRKEAAERRRSRVGNDASDGKAPGAPAATSTPTSVPAPVRELFATTMTTTRGRIPVVNGREWPTVVAMRNDEVEKRKKEKEEEKERKEKERWQKEGARREEKAKANQEERRRQDRK